MRPGIRIFDVQLLSQTVAASTVLVNATNLTTPIAANQKLRVRMWVPFTLGATGGFKFRLNPTQAPTAYLASLQAVDGVTALPGAEIAVVQAAAADFANAFAVAGSHYLLVEATILNGATAGAITLQFACNSAANSIILLPGSTIETIVM